MDHRPRGFLNPGRFLCGLCAVFVYQTVRIWSSRATYAQESIPGLHFRRVVGPQHADVLGGQSWTQGHVGLVAGIEEYRKGWLHCGLHDGGSKLVVHILVTILHDLQIPFGAVA